MTAPAVCATPDEFRCAVGYGFLLARLTRTSPRIVNKALDAVGDDFLAYRRRFVPWRMVRAGMAIVEQFGATWTPEELAVAVWIAMDAER